VDQSERAVVQFDPKQPVILEATVSMSGISNQAENARFSSLYIVRN
jgi:hypothetical protein